MIQSKKQDEKTESSTAFVAFQHVGKIYKTGEVEIEALKDVNFEIAEGEFCAIIGASGAGKTTILNILAGWIRTHRDPSFLTVQKFRHTENGN